MHTIIWTGIGILSGVIIMDVMKIKKPELYVISAFICGTLGFFRGYTGRDLITNIISIFK